MSMKQFAQFVVVVNFLTKFVSNEKICFSEGSRKATQFILSNLDTSVDPCVDMYKYTCGGWTRNNEIPKGSDKWSPVDQMQEAVNKLTIELLEEDGWLFKGKNSTAVRKTKQFYQSCTDVEAINKKGTGPLKKLIDRYGSWTVTPTNKPWDNSTWSLQKALQRSHKVTGSAFWGMYVDKDVKDESRNIIHISQYGLTLLEHTSEYYQCEVRSKFMTLANTVGYLLGGNYMTVNDKMLKVYKLEQSLAEIYTPPEQMQDPNSIYNVMNLTEFQNLIGPWINVEMYMEAIFGKGVLTAKDEINVETPDYFSKLHQVIKTTEPEVLANYIMWNSIVPTMGYLPEEFSFADVSSKKDNIKELDPLKNKCLEKTRMFMPFVTSALYVGRHFFNEMRDTVVTALEEINREFIKNLNHLSWLDNETIWNLKEKAEAMTNIVGYPEWILDPKKLDAKYEDLVTVDGDIFMNFLHAIEFFNDAQKKSLKQPPVSNPWGRYPDNVDASYSMLDNQVVVLAGLLQEPIVSNNYPKSYIYGTLGSLLAHEIIHAFDNVGRMFDKHGHLNDLWTPHVAEEFDQRSQCFIDQYNKYEVYGHNISGLLTLAENIADNSGAKMAYRAYKSSKHSNELIPPGLNLTNDQLYFIGRSTFFCELYTKDLAITRIHNDNHAHGEFRIIGVASNSKEFSAAFNCPHDSPMNPEMKCEIW